jgi:hypothetical protein
MESRRIEIKLLTPCFCGGAEQNEPEIRAPSVRGHLRLWHTRLYSEADMRHVWGSVGRNGGSSKIQLRVESFVKDSKLFSLLPHKSQGSGSRKGIPDGSFDVFLSSRDSDVLDKAEKVLRLWSLMGSLGTRANRAAGSVWPVHDAPKTLLEFQHQLDDIGFSCGGLFVSKQTGAPEHLRKAASDTLSIPEWFGKATPERVESPVKIKLVEFDDGLHLIMFAGQKGKVEGALQSLGKAAYPKPLSKLEWIKIFG